MNQKQTIVNQEFQKGISDLSESDLENIVKTKNKAFALSKHLGKFYSDFPVLWELLCDYRSGIYSEVPWKLIAGIVFAMGYLIMPIDIIPDVIPIAGFTDDISVFGLVLAGFASEIKAYKEWKADNRDNAQSNITELQKKNTDSNSDC